MSQPGSFPPIPGWLRRRNRSRYLADLEARVTSLQQTDHQIIACQQLGANTSTFNLGFPRFVDLRANGLPSASIFIFGPNARPAVTGPNRGNFLNVLRDHHPLFYIGYYGLTPAEEIMYNGLQVVLWVRLKRNFMDHYGRIIRSKEAGLIRGLEAFAQARVRKSQYPEPQLWAIDHYHRLHPQMFRRLRRQDHHAQASQHILDLGIMDHGLQQPIIPAQRQILDLEVMDHGLQEPILAQVADHVKEEPLIDLTDS